MRMDETYSILLAGLKAAEENLASTHFSRSGHRIATAGSVFDALEKLQAQRMDLIYFQASADTETVREIGEIRRCFPALPIVLACSGLSEGLVLEAWRAGATDIIFFPLVPQSLDASLQRGTSQIAMREPETTLPVSARFFSSTRWGRNAG